MKKITKVVEPVRNGSKTRWIKEYMKMCEAHSIVPNPDIHEYDWDQIWQITLGIGKVDTKKYENPDFSWRHMMQIRFALEKGCDVSALLDPNIDIIKFIELKCMLCDGIDIRKYINYSLSDLKNIHERLISEK